MPTAVQRAFGIQVVRALGGRRNRHWLVWAGEHKRHLVLRRWGVDRAEIDYERELSHAVAQTGWSVARQRSQVLESSGHCWSMAEYLPGEEPPQRNSPAELAQRGRLLAKFHHDTRLLRLLPRPVWRSPADVLADPAVETVLGRHPDAVERALLLWHLGAARGLAAGVKWPELPRQPVHGDFTAWNLRFQGGRLSGLLDLEMTRPAVRVADFALSWRGQYDPLVHAYHDHSPLSEQEWAAIVPAWWALLLEGAASNLAQGTEDDGWTRRMLRRSPLMDAPPYPQPLP